MSGSCTVTPGKVWNNEGVSDVKLNQTANPTVRVDADSITDRELNVAGLVTALGNRLINPNFFLNGNFDLPYWEEGLSPVTATNGVNTTVAKFWGINPGGANVTYEASTTVPDGRAFHSVKITGAASVTTVDFFQDLPAWISRGVRTYAVISARVLNNSGSPVAPQLLIYTADAANDFSAVTLRSTTTLQTINASASTWGQVYAAIDLSALTNASNGFRILFRVPSGTLNAGTKFWHFSEMKLEIGEDSSSTPSDYVFDSFDAYVEQRAAGGRVGYTTTALTNANQTLTRGTSTRYQRYTGTLSGAVVVNLSRTSASSGDEFIVYLSSVVVTGVNTLTFQENGSGSLKVYNTSITVTRMLRFVYTGSAWILIFESGDLSAASISGTLGIANGGTGQITNTLAFDALAPTTTQADLIYHNGTNNVRLAKGTALQQLRMNAGATAPEWATVSSSSDVVVAEDQKSSGTAGGTFTSGAWRTRDLNTEVVDTGSLCAIASNQITLQAGTYRVWANCSTYNVGTHQIRLQNITDTATLVLGNVARIDTGSTGNGCNAHLMGRFTIATAKVIEVQHRCQTTQASNGFGEPTSWGTEVYTQAIFLKE